MDLGGPVEHCFGWALLIVTTFYFGMVKIKIMITKNSTEQCITVSIHLHSNRESVSLNLKHITYTKFLTVVLAVTVLQRLMNGFTKNWFSSYEYTIFFSIKEML